MRNNYTNLTRFRIFSDCHILIEPQIIQESNILIETYLLIQKYDINTEENITRNVLQRITVQRNTGTIIHNKVYHNNIQHSKQYFAEIFTSMELSDAYRITKKI